MLSNVFLKTINRTLKYLLQFIFVVIICISIKVLCFEVAKVPSGSMENSIYTGEYIIINKLYFGPRLPQTLAEIPWLNFVNYIFSIKFNLSNYKRSKRIKGYGNIERGDILVFNEPLNLDNLFVKRCIGIPGDIVRIGDTSIFLNNHSLKDNNNIKYDYLIKFKVGADYLKILNKLGVLLQQDWFDRNSLTKKINISKNQLQQLYSQKRFIDRIRRYPEDTSYRRASLIFKEFCLPRKGLTIIMNHDAFIKYSKIINSYEDCNCQFIGDHLFNDHKNIVTRYTFKHDYFFMLGDNRDNSIDSRYWGLLPEYYIVGKANMILLPSNLRNFNRYFTIL